MDRGDDNDGTRLQLHRGSLRGHGLGTRGRDKVAPFFLPTPVHAWPPGAI